MDSLTKDNQDIWVLLEDYTSATNELEGKLLESLKLLMRTLAEQNLSVELDADIRRFIKSQYKEHIGNELEKG